MSHLSRRASVRLVSALLVVLAAVEVARAERWVPIGGRQAAIGGAGVAATEDATSVYWNPANLSFLPQNRPPEPADEEEPRAKGGAEKRTHKITPEEERKLGEKDSDRWTGYDAVDVEIAANAELHLTGDIVSRLDDIDNLVSNSDLAGAVNRAGQNPPAVTQQDFRNLVTLFSEVNGLNDGGDGVGDAGGGLFGRWKGFGLGFYTNTYIGLHPHVDLLNDVAFNAGATINQMDQALRQQGPIPAPQTQAGQQFAQRLQQAVPGISAQAASDVAGLAEQSGADLSNPDLEAALTAAAAQTGGNGPSIASNQSGASLRALSTQELGLGLAWQFLENPLKLGVGATPKLMHGITAHEDIFVSDVLFNGRTFDDLSKGFQGSRTESFAFGIDAGVTIEPFDWLRVGAVGRNLNQPRFKVKDDSDFILRPQFRGGIAVKPVPSFLITMDADLLPNKGDAVPGLRTRQIGGGLEWRPTWRWFGFALRGGAYGDLEDPRSGFNPVVTAGIGLKIAIVTIDVGAAVATRTETFRGRKLPDDTGAGVTIGFAF